VRTPSQMKASGIVRLQTFLPRALPARHLIGEFRDHQRRGQTTMPLLSDKPIFVISSPLGDIQTLGETPYGERRIIRIHGGTVEGERLNGKVLPGGADWQIVRSDGVVHLTARYTIATDRGGLILVNSEGYRHGPPEVMARLTRDETVDPSLYYFRT